MNSLLIDLQNAAFLSFASVLRRQVTLRNNQICDTLGQSFVNAVSMAADQFDVQNNSFQITPGYATSFNFSQRTFFTTVVAGVPYGIEYQVGDVIVNTVTPGRALVTVAGSLNRATDNFAVYDNTPGNNFIKSTNYAWTDRTSGGHHEIGQRISLPGCGPSGATLNTRVVKVFIGAALYQIQVEDTITAANGTTGVITATNPVTTVAV
jgi:hypothetical protein